MTYDALLVAKDEKFFMEATGTRTRNIHKVLGESYPDAFVAYLKEVQTKHFVADIEQLLPIISRTSIFSETNRLKNNGLVKAFVEVMMQEWYAFAHQSKIDKTTYLGKAVEELFQGGTSARTFRTATREIQSFLEQFAGIQSPTLQVATDAEDIESLAKKVQEQHKGIPAITVLRSLLGGSRLFHNGKLVNVSWHAKVQTLLSALK
jgi:hypothetical protein